MVDALFELFDKYGKRDYIGEDVSQIEHALQCARLAELDNFPVNVVLGAFLHDIGHLLGEKLNSEQMILDSVNYGTKNHEKLGADFLRSLSVPENICMFVENHVIAKRYLVYKDGYYYNQLSDCSKQTLKFQGGPMSEDEAKAFESSEMFEALIKMRSWDDLAKDTKMNLAEKAAELLPKYMSQLETLIK